MFIKMPSGFSHEARLLTTPTITTDDLRLSSHPPRAILALESFIKSGQQMDYCYRLIVVLFFAISPITAFCKPFYGAILSYAAIAKEPPSLNGYQFAIQYDPDQFHWRQFNVYFDFTISRFEQHEIDHYRLINIYSLAPVARYKFKSYGMFQPYLDLSIGPSYLTRTHIEKRNLGIHFAFQDRIGLGVCIGQAQQLSLGLHAVHYSNGRLSAHNSGITLPLVLDIGYRF